MIIARFAPRKRLVVIAVITLANLFPVWCWAADLTPVSRPAGANGLPPVGAIADSRTDIWGDAAMRQPNGASYEFFKNLLPPLRYVNAEFRHYPIVLCAPRSSRKVRLVGNGSAVFARANKPPMWFEAGTPITFLVGQPPSVFGQDVKRLDGPHFLDGYLPVVEVNYAGTDGTVFAEEAFAAVTPEYAPRGALMLHFHVPKAKRKGFEAITAQLTTDTPRKMVGNSIVDAQGKTLLSFASGTKGGANKSKVTNAWNYRPECQWLEDAQPGTDHYMVIFGSPGLPTGAASDAEHSPQPPGDFDAEVYQRERDACINTWKQLLSRSIGLETPEKIVNNAWRSTIVGNFMIAAGDSMNYSAGNAYNHLYQGECGDAMRALLLFGYVDAAREMLKPLLEFNRQATRFHVAGHKLQMLAFYYGITHDAETVLKYEKIWRPFLDLILQSREPTSGLLPKDRYAGDIEEQVYSLNSNANCWRALRDIAAMLEDMGNQDEPKRLRETAAEYRKSILAAVDKSERRETKPPFIPVALLADDPAYDPLTATRKGSYYNLIAPYVIGSEVFGQGSQREDWLLGYMQNHGAIAMGMIRTTPHEGQFNGMPGVNPLYGLRYQLALLRRDEREKALTGFYGHLAQGLTRDTFIGGEGSQLMNGDEFGRTFYLPPNSASNALFLTTLRYLLIQDWDLDEDSRPDTLRLLFGAPRRWLEDGKRIKLQKAPTMFGELSLDVESKLSAGSVEVRFTTPPRPTKTIFLRAPLPDGWQIQGVEVNGKTEALKGVDTVELSGRTGEIKVQFKVVKEKPAP